MLDQFIDYYYKAKKMQETKFQGITWTESQVDDDLVWNIPIYDVVNRRYAAFSSFLEAVRKGVDDPKNNGKYFLGANDKIKSSDFMYLCYMFRLCGSGINYKPKPKGQDEPFGTHGFGNFWIVDDLVKQKYTRDEWLASMPEKKFCDVKGYLLPMIKGGLYPFIQDHSKDLVDYLIRYIIKTPNVKTGIKEVVDYGNEWLRDRGFKRQNFVLTAFAMDMAEYFPTLVDPRSDVYVGSNARKCLKMILPQMKHDSALRHLCDITKDVSNPMDMEDVACDFIRYIENFQSPEHIAYNNNITYKNNVRK
tara:strand:- start:80 stop:997 length:918 start_codon:yes stop_codon:yes gene_type:complete